MSKKDYICNLLWIFIPINPILNMIIVKLKGENFLESALKTYKFKIYKTKQNEFLRKRQEFEKPSVKRRTEIKKAQYRQKIKK